LLKDSARRSDRGDPGDQEGKSYFSSAIRDLLKEDYMRRLSEADAEDTMSC